MQVTIKLFGIARQIVGKSTLCCTVTEAIKVEELLEILKQKYPDFQKLTSLLVALNEEYAENHQIIQANDEIALIPPVSGG